MIRVEVPSIDELECTDCGSTLTDGEQWYGSLCAPCGECEARWPGNWIWHSFAPLVIRIEDDDGESER